MASEFLNFIQDESYKGKTERWQVISKRHGFLLGEIRWWGGWRQYVFQPLGTPIFNPTCLNEIAEWCADLTRQHRELKAI